MDEKKRDDAADRAPRPEAGQTPKPSPAGREQDAPNYDVAEDGGRAIPVGDMNSANDE